MMRFCQCAAERGNPDLEPDVLLWEYQKRLGDPIEQRSRWIREGVKSPDDFVVCGVWSFLHYLQEKGLAMTIVSATSERSVKQEAALLNIDHFFGQRVYGCGVDAKHFSKRDVISHLLDEEKINGENLLSFGDGPDEIEYSKEVGGLGIGVASDEEQNSSGVMDPGKRCQLLKAGADIIIPDFRDAIPLIESIVEGSKSITFPSMTKDSSGF